MKSETENTKGLITRKLSELAEEVKGRHAPDWDMRALVDELLREIAGMPQQAVMMDMLAQQSARALISTVRFREGTAINKAPTPEEVRAEEQRRARAVRTRTRRSLAEGFTVQDLKPDGSPRMEVVEARFRHDLEQAVLVAAAAIQAKRDKG